MARKTGKLKAERSIEAPPYGAVGHGLSDDQFHGGAVCTTTWVADARYAWDRGVAMGRYLQGLKQGRLLGVRCDCCGRTMIPPRVFCEQCFRPVDGWVELKDTGTVNTFSLCYVTWDMKRLTDPQIPAVIEIDGASPGMGIMHLLGDVDPEDVRRGMRVKAVWKPDEEREGAITDIRYWKPL
ncbi:MAG: Zn-ribbon domain-containing OB-fold protein [candidate division WOR-3 bacterium]